MAEQWVKLHDAYYDHPKVTEAGPLAELLWLRGMAWCGRNRTDGVLPAAQVRRLCDFLDDVAEVAHDRDGGVDRYRKDCNGVEPWELAGILCDVGLWERHPLGYEYHNYKDWQRSKDEIEELARKRSQAGSKGGKAKASAEQTDEPAPSKPLANVKQSQSSDSDKEKSSSALPAGTSPQAGDDEGRVEGVLREYVKRKLASRPPGEVRDPAPWSAKTLENARREFTDSVLNYLDHFDVTDTQIADALVAGCIPASWNNYRRGSNGAHT